MEVLDARDGCGARVEDGDTAGPTRLLEERESMTKLAFYGIDAMHLTEGDEVLPGRLIVIEGTDGVGQTSTRASSPIKPACSPSTSR